MTNGQDDRYGLLFSLLFFYTVTIVTVILKITQWQRPLQFQNGMVYGLMLAHVDGQDVQQWLSCSL